MKVYSGSSSSDQCCYSFHQRLGTRRCHRHLSWRTNDFIQQAPSSTASKLSSGTWPSMQRHILRTIVEKKQSSLTYTTYIPAHVCIYICFVYIYAYIDYVQGGDDHSSSCRALQLTNSRTRWTLFCVVRKWQYSILLEGEKGHVGLFLLLLLWWWLSLSMLLWRLAVSPSDSRSQGERHTYIHNYWRGHEGTP